MTSKLGVLDNIPDEVFAGISRLKWPWIVFISKSNDVPKITEKLTKRGFATTLSRVQDADSNTGSVFALRITKPLICKIVVELDLVKELCNEKLESFQKILVANEALKIIKRTKDIEYVSAWLAHDKNEFDKIFLATDTKGRLKAIYDYLGPHIALYFGWLENYTKSLYFPAIVGVLVFIHQFLTGNDVDSTSLPYFAIIVAIWGTCFLEFWKRECNEMTYRWGLFGLEDEERQLELAKSAEKERPDQTLRMGVSLSVTAFLIYLIFSVVLYFVRMNIHAEEIFGKGSIWVHVPGVICSALPKITPLVFKPIASMLNQYEAHTTKTEAHNSLIFKMFALEFVNRYIALLYCTFWLKDLKLIRSMVSSIMIGKIAIFYGMKIYNTYLAPRVNPIIEPLINKVMAMMKKKKPATTAVDTKAANTSTIENDKKLTLKSIVGNATKSNTMAKVAEQISKQEIFERELTFADHEMDEEYLELIIQFGYVTMFAVAYPLTPLLACINCIAEAQLDLNNLAELRRPWVKLQSTIGSWQNCLEFLSFAAVITNLYLLAMVSNKLYVIVPSAFHQYLDNEQSKLILMLALEHILIALKVLLMNIIDDVPRNIQEEIARKHIEEKKALASERMNNLKSNNNPVASGSLTPQAENNDTAVVVDNSPDVLANNTSFTSLARQHLDLLMQSPFAYNPAHMTALAFTPMILEQMSMSRYFYIPAAVMFLSYFQTIKERNDRKLAIGIVTDSQLLRLVHKEMPSWFYDSDFERIEWLNKILQSLWPHISLAVEDIIRAKVEPEIASKKPAFLPKISFSQFTLGSVSPKLVGVRVLGEGTGSELRMDLELKWAGNPVIALKIATVPATVIEVANLNLSVVLRVELLEFTSALPCFRALAITFMKKPFLDFSLKLASLDVMSLGPSQMNLTTLINGIIHSALSEIALYPKKIIIPMQEGVDIESLGALSPVGTVTLHVKKALKLIRADSMVGGKSDPYVVVKSIADQRFMTKVIPQCLDPIWDNEIFEINVFDASTQTIELEVFDSDMISVSGDTSIGSTMINISSLEPLVKTEKVLKLEGVKRGELVVDCTFNPLVSANKQGGNKNAQAEDDPDGDVLFDAADLDDADADDDADNDKLRKVLARPKTGAKHVSSPVASKDRGQLIIANIKIKNIKAPSEFYLLYSSDFQPYVTFEINNQVKETAPEKSGNKDCLFRDSFFFNLQSASDASIKVKVIDGGKKGTFVRGSKRVAGEVVVPLKDLVTGKQPFIEREYMLSGGQESFVSFKMSWKQQMA